MVNTVGIDMLVCVNAYRLVQVVTNCQTNDLQYPSTDRLVEVGLDMDGFFFFSSRRRHTRSLRDWSSDVCSSDLKWDLRPSNASSGPWRIAALTDKACSSTTRVVWLLRIDGSRSWT